MRSIKTHVAAAAVLTASLVMVAPSAHAAVAPKAANSSDCILQLNNTSQAEAAWDAAVADAKKQVAGGGHLGKAEEDDLEMLKAKVKAARTMRDRVCLVTPVGPVHTGVGSTSQGTDTTEITAGLGMVGAIGAGALVLRRRRAGSEA